MNDVVYIFWYSKCLLFGDDLKMFRPVRTFLDTSNFQRDLDTLLSWCQQNGLDLNISKCRCISFYRLRTPIDIDYRKCIIVNFFQLPIKYILNDKHLVQNVLLRK